MSARRPLAVAILSALILAAGQGSSALDKFACRFQDGQDKQKRIVMELLTADDGVLLPKKARAASDVLGLVPEANPLSTAWPYAREKLKCLAGLYERNPEWRARTRKGGPFRVQLDDELRRKLDRECQTGTFPNNKHLRRAAEDIKETMTMGDLHPKLQAAWQGLEKEKPDRSTEMTKLHDEATQGDLRPCLRRRLPQSQGGRGAVPRHARELQGGGGLPLPPVHDGQGADPLPAELRPI